MDEEDESYEESTGSEGESDTPGSEESDGESVNPYNDGTSQPFPSLSPLPSVSCCRRPAANIM